MGVITSNDKIEVHEEEGVISVTSDFLVDGFQLTLAAAEDLSNALMNEVLNGRRRAALLDLQ